MPASGTTEPVGRQSGLKMRVECACIPSFLEDAPRIDCATETQGNERQTRCGTRRMIERVSIARRDDMRTEQLPCSPSRTGGCRSSETSLATVSRESQFANPSADGFLAGKKFMASWCSSAFFNLMGDNLEIFHSQRKIVR